MAGWAQRGGVEVLSSDAGGVYAALGAALQRGGAGLGLTFAVRVGQTAPATLPALVLTLGVQALREAQQRAAQSPAWAEVPILAALLPQSAHRPLAAQLPRGSSAVWLDQPVERCLDLLRLALPQRRRVGVLLGPASRSQEAAVDRATQARGLQAVKAQVDTPAAELYPALQTVLQTADVFLALPDPSLFSAEALQNILIASYRQRVPLLSYSAGHVRAGATLALHTPVEAVAEQVLQALRQWQAGRALPAPALAQGFAVAVNEQVARSLSLDLRSASELEAALRRQEGRP